EPLISIVDDDISLQNALVRLIRSLGYNARGFASAEAFLESGIMPNCSCVIADIHMQGMNGIQLANVIAERHPPVPVIMITARTEPDLEERVLASGASSFFRKPIDTKTLVQCINRVLER